MQLRSQRLQGACFKEKTQIGLSLRELTAFLQPAVWDWSDISGNELRAMLGVLSCMFLLQRFYPPVPYRKEILEHLIHEEGQHLSLSS